MPREKKVHIHHPVLGAVSEVNVSTLRVWQKSGWEPVDPELRSAAELAEAVEPEPPEPQFVMSYGELVPVDDPSAEVAVPEWTDYGASEVDEAAVAEADEETV